MKEQALELIESNDTMQQEPILSLLEQGIEVDNTINQSDIDSALEGLKTSHTGIVDGVITDDIYTKYEKLIAKAKDGYVSGYTDADLMKILRYVEGKLGKSLPMNLNCAPCVVDLILLFDRVR